MAYDRAVRIIGGKAARYVEYVWPQLEKRGGTPDTPMNRKERGRSSPAIPARGLDVVEENRKATAYLRFFLEETENGAVKSTNGVYFSEVLKTLRYDPGNLTNWRTLKTDEDRRMLEAFRQCMRHIAKGVVFVYGEAAADDEGFRVVVNPKHEQLSRFEDGRNKDANAVKTHNAHSRYRSLAQEIEEISGKKITEITHKALKEALSELNREREERGKDLPPSLKHLALPISYATARRARAFMRGELDEGEGYSRMMGEDQEAS